MYVCVCMCMCINICMHACVRACMHVVYVRISAYVWCTCTCTIAHTADRTYCTMCRITKALGCIPRTSHPLHQWRGPAFGCWRCAVFAAQACVGFKRASQTAAIRHHIYFIDVYWWYWYTLQIPSDSFASSRLALAHSHDWSPCSRLNPNAELALQNKLARRCRQERIANRLVSSSATWKDMDDMDDVESRFPWNCLVQTGGGHMCPRKLMSNKDASGYDVIFREMGTQGIQGSPHPIFFPHPQLSKAEEVAVGSPISKRKIEAGHQRILSHATIFQQRRLLAHGTRTK